jgi:hypothetical protein
MGPRLFRGAPCTNQGLPPSRPNTCRRESGGLLESGHADEGEGVTVGRGLGIDDVNALHARQSAEGGHVRAIGLVEDAVDHALDPVDFLEPGTGSLAEVMARETVACCALTVASWLMAADLAEGLAVKGVAPLACGAEPKVNIVAGSRLIYRLTRNVRPVVRTRPLRPGMYCGCHAGGSRLARGQFRSIARRRRKHGESQSHLKIIFILELN